MNKVMLTISDETHGDCLRACVASLLSLKIKKVPNFVEIEGKDGWFMHPENGLYAFLLKMGYEMMACCEPQKVLAVSSGVNGYFIAIVPSIAFSGAWHAVIFKGLALYHDPAPAIKWSGSVDDVKYFYMIEPRKHNVEPTTHT